MGTSETRPAVETGFLIDDDTVRSWVVVQNNALPNVLTSVCAAWRSNRNASK